MEGSEEERDGRTPGEAKFAVAVTAERAEANVAAGRRCLEGDAEGVDADAAAIAVVLSAAAAVLARNAAFASSHLRLLLYASAISFPAPHRSCAMPFGNGMHLPSAAHENTQSRCEQEYRCAVRAMSQ